jgi:hypothetical protein
VHSRAGWCGVARLRASKLAAALHGSWQSPFAVSSTSRLRPVADVPLSVAPESKTTPSILRRRSPWQVNDWAVTQGRRLVQTSAVGGGKRPPSLTNILFSCPSSLLSDQKNAYIPSARALPPSFEACSTVVLCRMGSSVRFRLISLLLGGSGQTRRIRRDEVFEYLVPRTVSSASVINGWSTLDGDVRSKYPLLL